MHTRKERRVPLALPRWVKDTKAYLRGNVRAGVRAKQAVARFRQRYFGSKPEVPHG